MEWERLGFPNITVNIVAVLSRLTTVTTPIGLEKKKKLSICDEWLRGQRYRTNSENQYEHRDEHIKNLASRQVTSNPIVYDDFTLICELDEQWSFVGTSKWQYWLWYTFNTKRKQVVTHVFGSRTDETCQKLSYCFFTTDDWGSYAREIESEKHLTGKIVTQRIERHNLNLRIHIKRLARKTVCFPCSF